MPARRRRNFYRFYAIFVLFVTALVAFFESIYLNFSFSIDEHSSGSKFKTFPDSDRDVYIQKPINTESTKFSKPRKLSKTIILAWTPFQVGKSDSIPWENMEPPLFKNCQPDLDCVITSDRKFLNSSSAVIFHGTFQKWTDLPPENSRIPDQYYVFAQWESPENTNVDLSPKARNFFNLTMTYRRDSEIFWPYGHFRKRSITNIDFEKMRFLIQRKRKLAAWFVSDCQTPSGRERFVGDLENDLKIDIFGKCGKFECPIEKVHHTALGSKRSTFCDKILTRDYKFYLALENSLCKDYITEKFFEKLQNAVIVPVVMERKLVLDSLGDDEMARIVNKSIIAVDDFENVSKLAAYLKYLDTNFTAYFEFFEWRRQFEIVFEDEMKPACQLCRLVKEGRRKVMTDIHTWWNENAACHTYKGT